MSRQSEKRRTVIVDSQGQPNPSAPYPATSYGTFTVYYSLRKVNANATAAIRVQRSSDNTQLDIGFIGRELDTKTLLNFCAGSTGTVTTWYDQSGTPFNATQGTLAAQPIIVNNGVLQRLPSGKPTLTFDGARWLTTGTGLSQVQPLTHFICTAPTSSNPNSPAGTMIGSTNASLQHLFSYSGTASQYKLNAGVSFTNITGVNSKPYVVCMTSDYKDAQGEVNPTVTRGTAGTNGIAGLEIGSAQTGQFRFFGGISEYAMYGSIGQNRKAMINRDMAAYWNVSYSPIAYPAYIKSYVFAGDSLTFGQNSTGTTNDWPSKYVNSKITAGTYFLMNTGFPGHTFTNMSVRANSESGLKNFFYPTAGVVLWIMGGTNDIIHDEIDATTCYNRLKAYVTGVIATGKFSAVYVNTIPPTGYPNPGGGTFASVIQAYNNLIRAGGAPGGDLLSLGIAAVNNLQANANFDDTPANVTTVTSNATYYNTTDKTHLTDAGYDLIAGLAAGIGS